MTLDPLSPAQRGAVDELIVSSQQLAVMADNFAETIAPRGSEQHAEALISAGRTVRSIIARLPQPETVWDGTLKDEHLTIEKFIPESRRSAGHIGVLVKHTITGIGRESSSKATYEENLAVARAALEQAVIARYARDYAGR